MEMKTTLPLRVKFRVKITRKNPYWQKPYWLRVWLHWTGNAPYQAKAIGAANEFTNPIARSISRIPLFYGIARNLDDGYSRHKHQKGNEIAEVK